MHKKNIFKLGFKNINVMGTKSETTKLEKQNKEWLTQPHVNPQVCVPDTM